MQGFDPQFLAVTGSRCQYLFYGVLRNLCQIDAALERLCARPPRAGLKAVLRVAAFEIISAGGETGRIPRVIDHAVGEVKAAFSKGESGMVNAVLRKMGSALREVLEAHPALDGTGLSIHFNHPEWLVERWLRRWGLATTIRFLEWNQMEPDTFVCLRERVKPPAGLESTEFRHFFRVCGEPGWEAAKALAAEGRAYFQDPGTRLAPAACEGGKGMRILDLCSAPGGKAWQLSERPPGELVCVDRPPRGGGHRYRQWTENLDRLRGKIRRVEGDLSRGDLDKILEGSGMEGGFDRVLVDVPCSNTGVIRRRPEVPWRLEPGQFCRYAESQRKFLEVAAGQVKTGGRLVYSTCSVEEEENEEVAEAFTTGAGGRFERLSARVVLPWEAGHDGAGIFSWKRVG